MVKTLVKKQLYELFSSYFINRKTGQRRTGAKLVGYLVAMSLVMVLMFVIFGAMALLLSEVLVPGAPAPSDWLYFALMGITALLLGVFGSVFNTYAGLYLAKDNELLLSMPIPAKYILLSRLITVFSMSLMYSGMVWIPAFVVYWVVKDVTLLTVIFPVLLTILISLLVSVLTCILGWLVAMISTKLKSKKIITVIISLAFFLGYYYVCFQMNSIIQAILTYQAELEKAIRGWLYPVYQLAMAATGDCKAMLIFTAIVLVAFVICYFAMTKSFIRIATTTAKQPEKKYDAAKEAAKMKAVSVNKALFNKELKRFLSSTTYMLNCGLGIIIMPVLAIVAFIKMDFIRQYVAMFEAAFSWAGTLIPIIAVCGVCMIGSINPISSSSVSLEGKNIWILQSLPVKGYDVLNAKSQLHFYLNIVPALIMILALCYVLDFETYAILLSVVMTVLFVRLSGHVGLILNLKMPNLSWTNETVPIKQSLCVTLSLFGGWLVSLAIAGVAFLLRNYISVEVYFCALIVICGLALRFCDGWLRSKGGAIFERLA